MFKYIVQRLLLAVPTIVGLTLVVFLLVRALVPVDMVDVATSRTGTRDVVAEQRLKEEFGLTGSLPSQYLRWLGRVMRGDMGRSFFSGRQVTDDLFHRIPTSLELGLGALAITLLVGIPIGLLSAIKQDSVSDYLARGSAILLFAVPGFWLATLVLVFGSMIFGWAPPIDYEPLWVDPSANVRQMVAPMLLMGLAPAGSLVRLVRTQVLEVIRQDYVRTAFAKGLAPRSVYMRHVLRNSMLPIVTVVGLQLPRLVTGTVIFEQIFVLPGVGQYLVEAVTRLDIYVLMITNLFFGTMLIMSNLAVDVSYALIDPRIRLARR